MFENLSDASGNFVQTLIESKKYWGIYLALIIVTCMSTISSRTLKDPNFEIVAFIIVAILGIFCIVFYFMNDSDEDLYKVAFVIIICFGIISALIVPIVDVSDEMEHLTRAEITSQGILFPDWIGDEKNITRLYNHTPDGSIVINPNVGFKTSQSHMFFFENQEKTVFETPDDTNKINESQMLDGSAFEQNPFYGYLPQGIGVFIAKAFDMNVIWMLWLPRIFNLVCYAVLISIAIKKAPTLKIPLLAVACIPISIYQAASVSIDSMTIGLGILTVAYFIYMYKSKPGTLEVKDIGIFCMISLLLGLCKLPYLAFVFLILLVPKENFKRSDSLKFIILGILIVSAAGLLWSHYATPTLMHSWRSRQNMNSTLQMRYMMSHPFSIMEFFKKIFTYEIIMIPKGLFNFFGASSQKHYTDNYVLITVLLCIYLAITLLFYPNKTKFNLKSRIGSLIILLMIYVGTCIIQLLTWSNIGKMFLGLSTRYFIPLFALLPIIVPYKLDRFKDSYDRYAMVLMIGFMATLILAFATKYY